ncbi:hypothetical protein A5784_01425 [Mycobacterium sp. 852013-50091_SCH5140682]|uniref:hypothetical protein n=1 Tax=Mycobacterium sp. 852013-50091_SCH5140682 TaxID=1834109 RepID=UPI0007EAF3C5|nr:hypothetical protein [Mycobacterium sp. 852013-50091_SCH5140682]OBC04202.1 hypothetical protein A5784_01425 [Mycobacterium sp. 852013-50091_SCH5140682]
MTKLTPPSASGIARFGRAAWFFGNTYEAVVGVPQLIAGASHRRPGIIGSGSPAPYYAPITPAAMGGTSVVLRRGWQGGADHRTVVAAAASLAGALGLSTYLIRGINIPLLKGEIAPEVQSHLIARWHRLNLVRLGLLIVTEVLVRRIEPAATAR